MSDDGERTTLTAATSKSKSLRTTIPAGIVRQFKLTEGSKLDWKIEVKEGELAIIVRPISDEKKNKGK